MAEPSEQQENEKRDVPAPPSEVSIRTLGSDLDFIKRSGGATPHSVGAAFSVGAASRNASKKSVWIIVAVLAAALGFVGYVFVYPVLKSGTASPGVSSRGTPANSPSAKEVSGEPPLLIHRSFFRIPAAASIPLKLGGAAESASDLLTYGQKLLSALGAAGPDFVEIAPSGDGGRPLSFGEFFSAVDAPVLDETFLRAEFVPDFTLFVYRDALGSWPGYVAAFRTPTTWLDAKPDLQKLERSPALEGLFAAPPGERDKAGFKDGLRGNQPIRTLSFSAAGAEFVYGVYRGYFLMSTSRQGFEKAISRL